MRLYEIDNDYFWDVKTINASRKQYNKTHKNKRQLINPKGKHVYGLYYDRKKKEYRAVGLTHLYLKDEKRFGQVNKGLLKPITLKEYDYIPSGVYNYYYTKTVSGNKIDLKSSKVKPFGSGRFLPKKQSTMIKKHAKRVYKIPK